ncbi:CYTH and CHAD domain-containing protein [Tropicimonas sp. IMCC34043]|uniref:CYTH and CHAD domain-containing protein n=1 Tax=Tropicimonas sp. IMCC34043 TaxID=2248760 RepID=UPI000E23DBE4|nr:CYTH and CHAD domain-containing protein [Tropicimonas sp. IMCC34043]
MTEIELKFVLDEDSARRLKTRLKSLGLAAGTTQTRTLRSVYFDTPDYRLRQAGTALRLRRDGRRWLQTIKSNATLSGGLQRSDEVETPAPGGRIDLTRIPEPALRAEIEAAVNGCELLPVCETVMKRAASMLTLPGGARVELSIDIGEIIAGDQKRPFREAELELIEGEVDALYNLTGQLFPDGGLHLSTLSKSARGFMLAETGQVEADPLPRNARDVPLSPAMTSEIAARDVLRECFDQIATNVDLVCATDAPEGPHQLRIGLRRLRSAFWIFRPIIGHPELTRLNDEARHLGAEVGALRDLDVVITDLVDPAALEHPAEPGFAALRSAVETRREAVRDELRRALVAPRTQAFQIDLACFIETRRWLAPEDFNQTARLALPIRAHADAALAKCWKSVRKRAAGIDHLSIEQRHELRKELKKLRYTIEFLGPLYAPKAVDEFVRRLKKLQTVFGDLNDLAMAEAMLCKADSPGARNAAAQRAVGWLLGTRSAHAETAWCHARELWNGLATRKPFWN